MVHRIFMGNVGTFLFGLLLILGMVAPVSAMSSIQTSMGDVVTLTGYSYGSPYAYLFLTGPNLPGNGVALDNINRRADQGGFTIVDVDGNTDRWTYKWNTGNVGGRLDTGAYTIWVVNGPNDRSRLNEAEFNTITVNLGTPTITVDTPALPSTLEVFTEPPGASVMLNEKYLGMTPLTLTDLNPGTYTLSISKFGYTKITTPVRLDAGKITTVDAPLAQQTGSLAINTTPAGAMLQMDGTPAGIAPVLLSNLSTGNHVLLVSHEGYVTMKENITVAADQIIPVTIILSPVTPAPTAPLGAAGSFMIPAGAAIFGALVAIRYRRQLQ